MKNTLIIYHRIDFDGICSMAVTKKWLESVGHKVSLLGYNYSDEAPAMETLLKYDSVVILDVTLPVEQMLAIRKADGNGTDFLWIDHHKSSIEDSVRYGYDSLGGHRDATGHGACELCWKYFYPHVPVPLGVGLLAAYDVFDKGAYPWEEQSLAFQYGMRQRYGVDADAFVRDFDWILDDDYVDEVTRIGRSIYLYARESGGRGVNSWGFEVTVAGEHRGLCCLTNQFGSLAFENTMRRKGISIALCVNRIGPDEYKVSMYGNEGNTLDLGAYLKEHYRGGGHRNAAGGTLTWSEFETLMRKCTI